MSTSVARLLADLAATLRPLGLRWYVFGAQAVVIHGRPRLTEDVDVTIDLDQLSAHVLADKFTSAGFALAEFADDEFVEATRVLPFVHTATGMALDVVLAGPGLEQLFLADAEQVDLGGVVVPVIRVGYSSRAFAGSMRGGAILRYARARARERSVNMPSL